MPTTTPKHDPERTDSEPELQAGDTPFLARERDEANEPLHVVPPASQPTGPVRIRTSRYGDLDEHELVRMLDSIEDELASRRFRESLYISFFLCVALAWVVLYGPRYLWHSPQLVNPADVMKHREVVELNAPVLHSAPAPRPAPKVDTKTLDKLRSEAPPAPKAPAPQPVTPAPAQPAPVAPTPAPPTPTLPSAPAPARPAAPVADAPSPQPVTKPTFGTPSTSDSMSSLLRDSARNRPGGAGVRDSIRTGKGASAGGGVTVLSDMQGVDFSDYLRRLQMDIYRNWIPLLPEETEAPLLKQGETYIEFSILPDGTIGPGSMKLVAKSGDSAIDKAAWGSITSEGQFPPLPKQFHGPNLTLRFHYLVNKNIQ
jgi:outer membrane biosynthesis protein TonB